MKLILTDETWEDCLYRQEQDKRMGERISKPIREIRSVETRAVRLPVASHSHGHMSITSPYKKPYGDMDGPTFEFTGLRGFLRRSGGLMGWALLHS